MLNVRKMEELGGAMGLQETLNSDLTSSSESNNIDVHMEKNTEYGALAILSASSYGNPNKVEDGGTTTGNATGVVMNLNKEWVAASLSSVRATNLKNATLRYKNVYTATYVAKSGDAILDWHDATGNEWINRGTSGLVRSYSGSIFSYNGYGGSNGTNDMNSTASYPKSYSTRAVVVSGQGL